jgi:iron complex transport system substrate-binding protein
MFLWHFFIEIKEENNMKLKKIMSIALAFLMLTFTLSGCGNSGNAKSSGTESTVSQASASASSQPTEKGTRTITDALGRNVEIPADVERIVPLGNTPRMIAYLGLADKVVGISGFDAKTVTPLQAYAYANKDLWSSLPVVGTDSYGNTDYYPETIISVKPDVVLCTYTKDVADNIQKQTGIPVVAVAPGTLFGEDYEQSLRILGDVCGAKDRAEEVISYINNSLDDLKSRTSNIADDEKPAVLSAAATFKGTHGIEGVRIDDPVMTAVDANNIAASSSKTGGSTVIVDKEQIISWDPAYIFLDSGGVSLVKEDYKSNPDYYAKLTAFKGGHIYQYPSSTCYFSNVEIPLANSYYVGKLLYPDKFSDIDVSKKANEIFKFFLGVDNYMDVLDNYGSGYEQVNLGDD